MVSLSNWCATFALNAAWQVTLLVAAASAAAWFLRRARPRWQHVIWIAAVGLCFFLPLATPRKAAVHSQVSLPLDQVVERVIAAGILLAAALRATQLVRGWQCARRWRQTAQPILSLRLQDLARECRSAMSLPPIPIREVPGLPGPLTCGFRHPVILLPQAFDRHPSDDVLRAALGHEMVHIRRRDYARNLLYEALLLPLAWHPAVRYLRTALDRTRELVCDEQTAAHILDSRRYARSLLAIAESVPASAKCQPALGVTDGGDIEFRVRRLISAASWPLSKRLSGSILALVMFFAAVTTAATVAVQAGWEARDVSELGIRPRIVYPPPPPPPPPPK